MSWAQRLKRVFGIEVPRCERCGGTVRIIASIEQQALIGKILAHVQERDGEPAESMPGSAQRSKRRGSVAAPCSAGPLLRSRDCRKTPRARPPASLVFPERRPPRVSRVFMFPIPFRQSFPAYRYLRGR
jgi:hypothetical protein